MRTILDHLCVVIVNVQYWKCKICGAEKVINQLVRPWCQSNVTLTSQDVCCSVTSLNGNTAWSNDFIAVWSQLVQKGSSLAYEPPHDKTNKVSVRPAKTQISLGIRPDWSESSVCAQWIAKDPSFLHADSEDSDQTGWMPRLIWVFAGCTTTLLVFSWGGSYKQFSISFI